MEDILKQIQSLKEDFMNLREVDDLGLGHPASDTPPSNNKIKRDVKTKNGKAELVSVQDELFPYDGNEKEQYRQKVINTINGMIQGTATLDDLMNIVRQKKVKPVKEGLFEGRKPGESKEDFKHRLHGELVRIIDNKADKAKQELIAGKRGAYDKYKKEHDKLDKLDDIEPVANAYANESWKKAIGILETALTAIRNSGLPKEKQQELTSKLAKGRAKERELADEKAFQSWAKGDRKQLDVQTVRDPEFTKNASGERETRLRSHSNNYAKSGARKIKPEWKQVEDSIKRHEKKFNKKEPLKEAIELLEGLFVNDGRGDLLDDVSKALTTRTIGQNMKKVAQGLTKKIDRKKCNENFDKNEEKEYNRCKALQLWEQVINELEDGAVNRAINNMRDKIDLVKKIQAMSGSKEFKDVIEDAIAKKNHQIEVVNSKKEDRVINRVKKDEAEKKKRN